MVKIKHDSNCLSLSLLLTGTQWMNWTFAGCVAVCIPVLLLQRVRYNRLNVDIPDVNAVSQSLSARVIESRHQHTGTANADSSPD